MAEAAPLSHPGEGSHSAHGYRDRTQASTCGNGVVHQVHLLAV